MTFVRRRLMRHSCDQALCPYRVHELQYATVMHADGRRNEGANLTIITLMLYPEKDYRTSHYPLGTL